MNPSDKRGIETKQHFLHGIADLNNMEKKMDAKQNSKTMQSGNMRLADPPFVSLCVK